MIQKIRVILDTEQDVFRDIEIKTDQTLLELHHCIKDAFDLDGDEMASFYLSNDEWFQGSEIPLEDTSDDQMDETMDQVYIKDVLPSKGGRCIYVYDFLEMWTFFCEVVEADVVSINSKFPTITMEYGQRPSEAPEQNMFGDLDVDLELNFDDDDFDDENYYDPDNYY